MEHSYEASLNEIVQAAQGPVKVDMKLIVASHGIYHSNQPVPWT